MSKSKNKPEEPRVIQDSLMANKKAKRDHVIFQNKFHIIIKKGELLDDIPEQFYKTLKTEKVI